MFRTIFLADRSITRQEICQLADLNLPLVSRVTTEMLEAGLLEETSPPTDAKRRGRRCTALQLSPGGAYVIAIAITAYSQKVILGNLKGHIIYSKTIPGAFVLTPQELVALLIKSMQDALQASGISTKNLLGGSMAIPRHMLLPGDTWPSTPNIESYVLNSLEKKLGIRLISMRLAEILNLAEVTWGVSQGFKNVLCLHAANLIGASLLHGGALLFLPDRIGNIINMPVARIGTSTPHLPRIGNIASGMSILNRLGLLPKSAQLQKYTIEDTCNLALVHSQSLTGNTQAQAAFTDAGEWMGHALETLYQAYHPDVIVLSGTLIENPYYIDAMLTSWRSLYPLGTPVETRIGTISVGSAAILTALQYHITLPELDIEHILTRAS